MYMAVEMKHIDITEKLMTGMFRRKLTKQTLALWSCNIRFRNSTNTFVLLQSGYKGVGHYCRLFTDQHLNFHIQANSRSSHDPV